MGQITINISDERKKALEAEATSRGISVEELVEERLEPGLAILHRAWANAAKQPPLTEDEAMELAIAETRAVRNEMWRERHADTPDHS